MTERGPKERKTRNRRLAEGSPALGLRIKKARLKRHWSQDALARHINRSAGWLLLVEKGQADPLHSDLVNIADALDITVRQLVSDDPDSDAATHPPRISAPPTSQPRATAAPEPAMMEADPWPAGTDPDEWLEEMRRRAFVRAAATLTGATAVGWWPPLDQPSPDAAVTQLRTALVGDEADVDDLPSVELLRAGVGKLWADRQRSRYSEVMTAAPILLRQAQMAASAFAGDDRLAALALLAAIYQAITGVLRKMGDLHLAAIAADRGMAAARENGSAVTWADSVRFYSLVLGDAGHHDQAVRVCVAAADRLRNEELSYGQPSALSIYGQLLLTSAGAAAKGGDRALADDFFNDADRVAGRLGADANHLFTAFGPTNIDVHRVHAAVVLGDGVTALRRARRLDLTRLPVLERRAHHLIDVALGYNLTNKPEEATVSLLSAEQVAPEEVRYDPRARLLVEQLRNRGQAIAVQLDSLASRMQPLPS